MGPGPRPDLNRAYFWPAINKRPTCLWPGYFLTLSDPMRFFYPKGNKLKNLGFLEEIFQTQTKDGWPDPTRPNPSYNLPDPGQNFWPRPITNQYTPGSDLGYFTTIWNNILFTRHGPWPEKPKQTSDPQ